MKITLVRHAEVMFEYRNKIAGYNNVKISKKGVIDCLALKDKIKGNHYDICFMSPLARCVETAFLIVGDRVLTQIDDRLIERDMGNYTGKDYKKYNSSKYWDYQLNCKDENVECIEDLFKRCSKFLKDVSSKYKDKDIMIVSHEAVIRVLYILINGIDLKSDLKKIDIPNCYIEEFDYTNKKI